MLVSVSSYPCKDCGGPVIVKIYERDGIKYRTTRDDKCRVITSIRLDLAIKVLSA